MFFKYKKCSIHVPQDIKIIYITTYFYTFFYIKLYPVITTLHIFKYIIVCEYKKVAISEYRKTNDRSNQKIKYNFT